MVANCERMRALRNQLKFLSRLRTFFASSQKWVFSSGMTFSVSSGSRVAARANQLKAKKMLAMKKQTAKSQGEARALRRYPAPMADPLMKRFASPACIPKKVPRESGGMILEIIEVQALAVKPPPNPCQISSSMVRMSPAFVPISGINKAMTANPKNGTRS